MQLLSLVPSWLWALLLAASTAFGGIQTVRLAAAKHTLADLRAAIVTAREQRVSQNEAQREIERFSSRAVAAAADRAVREKTAARVDRERLDAAARRVRDKLGVSSAGEARADSTAAAGSEAGVGAGLVLRQLFGRTDERLRSCAAALDDSRAAGLACERAYDAVSHGDEQQQDPQASGPLALRAP